MDTLDHYSPTKADADFSKNKPQWEQYRKDALSAEGFIERQSVLTGMKYGTVSVSFSGCEVIAVYNALHDLLGDKDPQSLPELIRFFELHGMAAGGKFGTSPCSVPDYFRAAGFEAAITADSSEYDLFERRYSTFVLSMYNDGSDISKEIHTVSVTRDNAGYFVMHNAGAGRNSCSSINQCIKAYSEKACPICLTGIKRKISEGCTLIQKRMQQ